jgi:hypothetical protein
MDLNELADHATKVSPKHVVVPDSLLGADETSDAEHDTILLPKSTISGRERGTSKDRDHDKSPERTLRGRRSMDENTIRATRSFLASDFEVIDVGRR